jgi:hypothetical protein
MASSTMMSGVSVSMASACSPLLASVISKPRPRRASR